MYFTLREISDTCTAKIQWPADYLAWDEVDVIFCWLQDAVSIEDCDIQMTVFKSLVHQLPPPHYRSVMF